VRWWRTDDLFVWALDALIIYVRAAAERLGEPVAAVCARLAARHGVELSTSR
jgi:putative intracellular protease/amidase